MRRLVTAAAAAGLDAAVSSALKIPPVLLMEKASLAIWDLLQGLLEESGCPAGGALVALAGTGNNGGDALALLRHASFAGRKALAAVCVGESPGELCALELGSLEAMGIEVLRWPSDAARVRPPPWRRGPPR